MMHGENLNALKIRWYRINYPVLAFNEFPNMLNLKFWNYTSQIRCVCQAQSPVERLLNNEFCLPIRIV